MPKYSCGDGISFDYQGETVSGNIISQPSNVGGVFQYQVEFMFHGDLNYDNVKETDIKGIV